ncbi:MAG: glycosyltransferase [Clostridia bacterium]|nr:glycosyl transferase [Clostridium sp. CAG:798]
MKISIIVPIYNVEKQISRCIESLLEQESEKLQIEIILVNDGTKDNSGEIAKEYAKKNMDKIIYLEKENGGLSDARNFGIKYATGTYLAFVDSDDYISDNLYSSLIDFMNQKYDLIKIKATKVDENGNKIEENYSPEFYEATGEEAFDILYKSDKMTEIAWIYIYRTEFFKNNGFEFAKGLYHEDFGLIPLIILKAKKVASTKIGTYFYVQTQNSITRGDNSKKIKRAEDLLKHYDNMIKEIKKYDISEKSKQNIKTYFTNCILIYVDNLQGIDRKNFIKQIRSRKMKKNIKVKNLKQLIKRIILNISIDLYLKLR